SLIQSVVVVLDVVLLGSLVIFAVARYSSVISFFLISAFNRLREIVEIRGGSSGSLTRGSSMSSRVTMPFSGCITSFRPLRNGIPKIASQLGKGNTYDAFDWVILSTSIGSFLVWVFRVNWLAFRMANSIGTGLHEKHGLLPAFAKSV